MLKFVEPLLAGLLVLTSLAACNREANPDTAKTDAATGTTAPGAVNSGMGGGMTDPNIFYVLDASNLADSAKGALASSKGTSADVREFAKIMVRDHHSLRQQGQNLSKRLAIQPTPPAADSLPAKLDTAMARLTAAAKGRDFDKAYIDHEVSSHLELLTLATSAMGITRNSEIKNLIQKAAPIIQAHLDRVQAIQKNLQK